MSENQAKWQSGIMNDLWKMVLVLIAMTGIGFVEIVIFAATKKWLERKFGEKQAKRIAGVFALVLGVFMIVTPYFYLYLTWPK